ncbi:hypothetical protein L3Q82_003897 [Scortum barcoo]|uniref:Uncharacterized protein n=1 Tax=Scortum barcoo TaxID=214431 RepID=A0ACB8X5I0_9TELE|nr:hypothetical protein L3Q82_003897 [Scortum barcoo]
MMSHSDIFTYHLVAMEIIGVFGSIICCCNLSRDHVDMLLVGLCLWSLTWYGEMFFHILTCVERYLAVIHPITYLSLRRRERDQSQKHQHRLVSISRDSGWNVLIPAIKHAFVNGLNEGIKDQLAPHDSPVEFEDLVDLSPGEGGGAPPGRQEDLRTTALQDLQFLPTAAVDRAPPTDREEPMQLGRTKVASREAPQGTPVFTAASQVIVWAAVPVKTGLTRREEHLGEPQPDHERSSKNFDPCDT